MFLSFFYHLRAYGLNVTPDEWVMLCEALEKGLSGASLLGFYHLCRAVLVTSETEFDRFDRAFADYFRMVARQPDLIPDALLQWLDKPSATPGNFDEQVAELNELLSSEEIARMLAERIKEQKEEHNGGSYWVGTGGMSVFGNLGTTETGIRVGGKGVHQRALTVAGERRYRDFTKDRVIDTRQFQTALRYLRQYSSLTDALKTEVNAELTAQETGKNGGILKVVYERPRRNSVKLLMLMDSGGSMEYYSRLCTSLFQAVSKSNRFHDLKIYYFHNAVYDAVYETPECAPENAYPTDKLLRTLNPEYKLIIVGDAQMAPYELMSAYYAKSGGTSGLTRFRRLKNHFTHTVWLNPSHGTDYWHVSETYSTLKEEFDMYYLTVDNLVKAMKKLISAR